MRPYGLGLHALSWQLLVTALVSSSDALVSVNRTHTDGLQNHSKATSPQLSQVQEVHASLALPRLISRSKATHSVPVPMTLSKQPEQNDLPGPPPLLKLHYHLFLLMAACLVALGVQRYRMALSQVPQDADPSDPLAYVFKARQLQQSEGSRGRL
eukprot:s2744_g19.t1